MVSATRIGRRAVLAAAIFGIGRAAWPDTVEAKARGADMLVYVGTQGSAPGGGIFVARLDWASGRLSGLRLAAELERPTWITTVPGRERLYAVSETGNDGASEATVHAFAANRQTGILTAMGVQTTAGAGATHLDLDTRSGTMFVANYGDGHVAALPLAPDGGLLPVASHQADYGSGPTRRQSGPHAHSVTLTPDGHHLLVGDLGADRVFVYRFDPATRALTPADPPFVAGAAGSGPRHAAFLPNGRVVYVNSELTGALTAYRWDAAAGRLTPFQTISTLAPDHPANASAAEVRVAPDGRFLYVSSRGEDVIVTYRVDPGTAMLSEVQRMPCGGKGPWSFALDPAGRWLVVANQASSTVNVFAVDRRTGKLAPVAGDVAVPKPTSIAFLP